jgi:hypothetical protein
MWAVFDVGLVSGPLFTCIASVRELSELCNRTVQRITYLPFRAFLVLACLPLQETLGANSVERDQDRTADQARGEEVVSKSHVTLRCGPPIQCQPDA